MSTTWELDKDDPIWLWLESYCVEENLAYENLDMVATLKAMPQEMSKEFLRRMITSEAVSGLSASELKNISRLAFTQRPNVEKALKGYIENKKESR